MDADDSYTKQSSSIFNQPVLDSHRSNMDSHRSNTTKETGGDEDLYRQTLAFDEDFKKDIKKSRGSLMNKGLNSTPLTEADL